VESGSGGKAGSVVGNAGSSGVAAASGKGGRGLDFGTLGFLVRAWESDGDWVCYEQREGRPGGLQPPHPPFIRIQRRAVARHALAPRARRLLVLLFLRLPSFKSHANTIEEGMQKFAI
jgi:hypothetical protein